MDTDERYDALLLVSFGGPEGPADVEPFLRNVTRGRGVPPQRLAEVAKHYLRLGGVSPINGQNRALVAAIEADLAAVGDPLPVYWGNRHWRPYLADELARMRDDGVERAAAFLTSAYASASGCRQYLDAIVVAREQVGAGAPKIDRLRQYYNHPRFIEPMVDKTREALGRLPDGAAESAALLFVGHSVPEAMDAASGPDGGAYARQLAEAARLVAERVGGPAGGEGRPPRPWRLAYCSRSGSPDVPWLEPDVAAELTALAAAGVAGVVIVPIGFVSDHMEVVFDLDTEALEHAARLGLPTTRAATVGTDPRFVALAGELIAEREGRVPARVLGVDPAPHDACPVRCCGGSRLDGVVAVGGTERALG